VREPCRDEMRWNGMRCDESATRGTARCHGICSLINNLTLVVLITAARGMGARDLHPRRRV